jgi:RNA-directed DNA polymerase
MMNEYGKSDSSIVPEKSSNKVRKRAAEEMEGRGLAKGNPLKSNASRTQSRTGASCVSSRSG